MEEKMAGFRDLKVWQRAKKIAVEIYRLTQCGSIAKDFGFKDQIRRSALSIPCNIAEGDERATNKEAIYYFYVAKGSLAELQTQLEIAFEIEYIEKSTMLQLLDECTVIGKMLGSLIKARSNNK